MSETLTSMDFRKSINFLFANSSDFRQCLKSQHKVQFSATFLVRMCLKSVVWNPTFLFGFQMPYVSVNPAHNSLNFRQVWISDKFGFHTSLDFRQEKFQTISDFRHHDFRHLMWTFSQLLNYCFQKAQLLICQWSGYYLLD